MYGSYPTEMIQFTGYEDTTHEDPDQCNFNRNSNPKGHRYNTLVTFRKISERRLNLEEKNGQLFHVNFITTKKKNTEVT
jgi:hypothetical protein